MVPCVIVQANLYYDSVSLMAISQQVTGMTGVEVAVAVMGTDMNKELLRNVGLLTAEAEAAGPSDLVIAIGAQSEAVAHAASDVALGLLQRRTEARAAKADASLPRTVAAAVRAMPGANLALISVPGIYAAREARLALESGLHVMLYSDNVALADEVRLKQIAHEKGLLLMGPDCGTAILGGVGLGFANAVRPGAIGIVAASGTGAQELSCLIDRLGAGISHLIGTGGRDLSLEVGGRMMLDGLRLLQEDPATQVIVLLSKPPAPAVAERISQAAAQGPKPVVICFLGEAGGLSIDEAAVRAVGLAMGEADERLARGLIQGDLPSFQPRPGSRFVRGLFSGGTLCDQALMILEGALGPVTCNVHPDPTRRGGAQQSCGHTLVDLGDDLFTRGRPHPMIDMRLRCSRMLQEVHDPATAVLLLDVVLGYGAHHDPAGGMAEAIRSATSQGVAVVASVTGTENDPQRRSRQVVTLQEAGALVLPTARQAAQVVAACVKGE